MNRREFLTAAGGSAAATTAVAAGSAAAQEGEGGGGSTQPDWGGYLSGANVNSFTDARGQSEVTVTVGAGSQGLAFDPTGLWVDPGTTVTWEWNGEGGGHNVILEEGPASGLDSGAPVAEAGTTYSYTFENGGINNYYCQPHQSLGMLGAVAVGNDVPTVQVGGGGGEKELEELGVPIQAHWVGSATILGIIVTVIYTFYILKYGESPNTGTGRNG
jgi:halocyanin-like protein